MNDMKDSPESASRAVPRAGLHRDGSVALPSRSSACAWWVLAGGGGGRSEMCVVCVWGTERPSLISCDA